MKVSKLPSIRASLMRRSNPLEGLLVCRGMRLICVAAVQFNRDFGKKANSPLGDKTIPSACSESKNGVVILNEPCANAPGKVARLRKTAFKQNNERRILR
ncbi:hypothetical protein EBR21_03400 [bacterium]|nr:hypothetical protein [bacterium]